MPLGTHLARFSWSQLQRRLKGHKEAGPHSEHLAKSHAHREGIFDDIAGALPLALTTIGTKLHQIRILTGALHLRTVPAVLAGDLVFLAIYIAGWLILLGASRGPLRIGMRVLFYVVTSCSMLLLLAGYFYFLSTRAELDWEVLSLGVWHSSELRHVVASEIRWSTVIALVGGVLLTISPMLRRLRPAEPGRSRRQLSSPVRSGVLAACACALVLGLALSVSPVEAAAQSAASNLHVRLFRGAIQAAREARQAQGRSRVPSERGPLLVATAPKPRRNVVIVILESSRARSFTPYSPELPTTTFASELARRGRMVATAFTVVPHTTKALVSIQCGIYPALGIEPIEANAIGLPSRCLAALLREKGYATAFFQPAEEMFERRRELVGRFGYETFRGKESIARGDFDESSYFGWEDAAMLPPIAEWLDQQKKPFLLSVLTVATHHPYRIPRGFPKAHLSDDVATNQYLNTLRYQDDFLRKLFGLFEARSVLENTLFVVLGDHGESMGEHGLRMHDDVVYDEGLAVPMFLVGPEIDPEDGPIHGLRQHIDVLPTVLEVLGYSAIGELPGASLLSSSGHSHLYFSCSFLRHCLARRAGTRKVIHYFGRRADELFDLASDPMERTDLAEASPAHQEEIASAVSDLHAWREDVDAVYKGRLESELRSHVSRSRPSSVKDPLNVEFGQVARLLGVTIDKPKVKQRDLATIRCYWEALAPLSSEWRWFVSLDGPSHVTIDTLPPELGEKKLRWLRGDFVTETVSYSPRPETPPGTYKVTVGLYQGGMPGSAVDSRAVPSGPPEFIDENRRARVGTIEVLPDNADGAEGDADVLIDRSPPPVQHPLEVTFGTTLRLLGYDLQRSDFRAGEATRFALHFQVLSKPSPGLRLFVHQVGPKMINWDRLWAGGSHPISEWEPGEYLTMPRILATSATDPVGEYDLVVGLWDESQPSLGIQARVEPIGHGADGERRVRTALLRLLPPE